MVLNIVVQSVGEREFVGVEPQALAQLGPEHLMLLRDQMTRYPDWQTTFPYIYQALASPALPDRLKSVTGPAADPQAVAATEAFRRETLAFIDSASSGGEVDTELAARARQAISSAPASRRRT